jgi:hypothetical protein
MVSATKGLKSATIAIKNLEVHSQYKKDTDQGTLYTYKTFSGRRFGILKNARKDGNVFVKAWSKTSHKLQQIWLKVLVLLHIASKKNTISTALYKKTLKKLSNLGDENPATQVVACALLGISKPLKAANQIQKLKDRNIQLESKIDYLNEELIRKQSVQEQCAKLNIQLAKAHDDIQQARNDRNQAETRRNKTEEKKDRLKTTISNLKQQLDITTNTLNELYAKKAQLDTDNAQLEQRLKDTKTASDQRKEKAIHNLRTQITNISQEKKNLETELKKLNTAYEKARRSYERTLHRLISEHPELKDEVQQLAAQNV